MNWPILLLKAADKRNINRLAYVIMAGKVFFAYRRFPGLSIRSLLYGENVMQGQMEYDSYKNHYDYEFDEEYYEDNRNGKNRKSKRRRNRSRKENYDDYDDYRQDRHHKRRGQQYY